MRRSLAAIAITLVLGSAAFGGVTASDQPQVRKFVFPKEFAWSGVPGGVAGMDMGAMPSADRISAHVMSILGEPALKWPAKQISLDVKNQNIRRVAEILGDQTGICFVVKDAVPQGLKITIQVGGMEVKQFLDTLCAATNLTYIAESRAQAEESNEAPKDSENKPTVSVTAPQIQLNQSGEGIELVAPSGTKIMTFNVGVGKPVTHVTISSLAAEGVIVNMGTVSLSMKNADPIEAVTKLIKQINGASYMIMDLKDYLALQDADRAAEIEKAVQSCPRAKITLTLRNVPIQEALTKLAEAGHFYIATPQPGRNNFLIIPDVKVTDPKPMPGLTVMPGMLGDIQSMREYMFKALEKSKDSQ